MTTLKIAMKKHQLQEWQRNNCDKCKDFNCPLSAKIWRNVSNEVHTMQPWDVDTIGWRGLWSNSSGEISFILVDRCKTKSVY